MNIKLLKKELINSKIINKQIKDMKSLNFYLTILVYLYKKEQI